MQRLFAFVCLCLVLLGAGPARADDDQDKARQALQAGQVMPLRQILDRVEREQPGQVLEVELEQEEGQWLYEIKLLRADGSLAKLKVDARDGRILKVKGRGGEAARTPERKP